MDAAQPLRDFKPSRPFFVGIDSDGCVFDTMEVKHKECFVPAFIKHFRLQAVSRCARQTWEFVNLYSRTRGCNRFPALSLSLGLLRPRREVLARHVSVADTQALDDWIKQEPKMSNQTLAAAVQKGNSALAPVLAWSEAVNASVADLVEGVPPFEMARVCLEQIGERADVMVISQTPGEALHREWAEHRIDAHVKLIAGQEMGSKTEHLRFATRRKYDGCNVLMIGDAPGDCKAAAANGALFYPIVPGREEESWRRLSEEGLDRFFSGRFAGAYADELRREFDSTLPEHPHW